MDKKGFWCFFEEKCAGVPEALDFVGYTQTRTREEPDQRYLGMGGGLTKTAQVEETDQDKENSSYLAIPPGQLLVTHTVTESREERDQDSEHRRFLAVPVLE